MNYFDNLTAFANRSPNGDWIKKFIELVKSLKIDDVFNIIDHENWRLLTCCNSPVFIWIKNLRTLICKEIDDFATFKRNVSDLFDEIIELFNAERYLQIKNLTQEMKNQKLKKAIECSKNRFHNSHLNVRYGTSCNSGTLIHALRRVYDKRVINAIQDCSHIITHTENRLNVLRRNSLNFLDLFEINMDHFQPTKDLGEDYDWRDYYEDDPNGDYDLYQGDVDDDGWFVCK